MWLGCGLRQTVWFLILGVCSITRFGLFVWFGISVIPFRLICLAPSGRLRHWRDWIPPSIRSASSVALDWCFLVDPCSYEMCYSPEEFPGVFARSILSALIWTGCLCCPLCLTDSRGTNWPSPGSRWTWQAWYSHCRDSFRFSERRRRSAVLPNSRYSSPQQSAISGPVIAQRWWRRRNKVVF